METRRDNLKIIGAIGATCAFPFAADELYGQHVHAVSPAAPEPAGPYVPKFFSPAEFEIVSKIAGLIIPATDTPGAIEAGVPRYIDGVVDANHEHQQLCREGLRWLARHSFAQLAEAQQIKLLTPLSDAVDANRIDEPAARFFSLMKNLTADGYYTSRTGLVEELGYSGNTARGEFPRCTVREH